MLAVKGSERGEPMAATISAIVGDLSAQTSHVLVQIGRGVDQASEVMLLQMDRHGRHGRHLRVIASHQICRLLQFDQFVEHNHRFLAFRS